MIRLNSGERDNRDFETSVLYLTYLQTGILPSVDDLLDWRLKLEEMKKVGEFPADWFDKEIQATDYLLSLNNL